MRRIKKKAVKRAIRDGEKAQNKTVRVKRRCDGLVSVEAFEMISQGRDLKSCGSLSWEDLLEKPEDLSDFEPDFRAQVRVVPGVIDVLVFPSSVVTEFCDGFSCYSLGLVQRRGEVESSQVKAIRSSRRRMMPPTPLQNSNDTFEEDQEAFVVEDQMWSAKERTIIARTKQYLEESYSVKVEAEELEELLGPDDVDVDARRILKEASDAKGCATFETFSSDGLSEFLVASRSRWDKYKRKWNAPWRQNSSASASEGWVARRPGRNSRESDGVRWKKVYGGSGRLPGTLRPRER